MIEDSEVKHIWQCIEPEFDQTGRIRFEKGWYFSDETEDVHGPYATREAAIREFERYCDWLMNAPPPAGFQKHYEVVEQSEISYDPKDT